MKVLVINPVGHSTWDEQDREIYRGFASPKTEVEVVSLPHGPASVETPEAHAEVIPLVIDLAKKSHSGYDAVIVNCCLDPGVSLLKGIIKKPVIGPCESSLAIASVLGRKPSVITVGKSGVWMIEDRVKELGYGGKVVSVRGISVGVLDIDKDREKVRELLVSEVEKAVKEDSADIAVLGCTGLAGLAKGVQDATGVPVVDPAGAAIKMAEASVRLGLYNAVYGR
jgi:allantoin racemase